MQLYYPACSPVVPPLGFRPPAEGPAGGGMVYGWDGGTWGLAGDLHWDGDMIVTIAADRIRIRIIVTIVMRKCHIACCI